MIKVQNLVRDYGDFRAVNDVSFEIKQGEIIGLLGHNGAGKTTIMKMITGALEPTEGLIEVAGLSVVEDRLAVQEKIGYLPEDAALYDEMTVLQYLDFIADLRGMLLSEKPEAIGRVISQTKLKEKASAPIHTLSKGYKQRVGVAQALLRKPDVLILDEPTNGLDPQQIDEMRGLIKELSKEATIILSTHILQEVEAICTRVLIISAGKLALDSELEGLRKQNVLRVGLQESKDNSSKVLSGLGGVLSVDIEKETDKTVEFLLKLSEDVHTLAPKVAQAIVKEGLKLERLEPYHENLEEVFKQTSNR